jgi:hypothetical protein
MKPVYQDLFGQGKGNCFPACIASILEIPIEQVPHLVDNPDDAHWIFEMNRWANSIGLGFLLTFVPEGERSEVFFRYFAEAYTIRLGKTDDGGEHAAIYHRNQLVHDPTPGGTGITECTSVVVFFPLDPAKHWRDHRHDWRVLL